MRLAVQGLTTCKVLDLVVHVKVDEAQGGSAASAASPP
jgi:hypothetical protein